MSRSFINRVREAIGLSNYRPLDREESTVIPGAFVDQDNVFDNNNTSHATVNSFACKVTNAITYLIVKPVTLVLVVALLILEKFLDLIYFRDRGHTRSAVNSGGFSQTTIPIDKANRFIRDLEDNLPPDQLRSADRLPPFFSGSYTQALYMAVNRAKFLFVFLTNPHNENSSTMFRRIVTTPEFIELFSQNKDLLIWGGNLADSEAYQLANSFGVTKFPFLGLLCLTRSTKMTPEGPIKTPFKISLVSKIQGNLDTSVDSKIIIETKIKKKIRKYEDELSLIRNELRDRFMSQVLLKQQNINYQNSLASDRIKKQEKLQESLKEKYLIHKLGYFKDLKDRRREVTTRIAIKLQDGVRITFDFPPGDCVENIFIYVELLNRGYFDKEIFTPLTDEEAEDIFKDYKPSFSFKLITRLPPRKVLNDMMDQQIRNLDFIYPSGFLIAEDL